jgi:hypothetical protein
MCHSFDGRDSSNRAVESFGTEILVEQLVIVMADRDNQLRIELGRVRTSSRHVVHISHFLAADRAVIDGLHQATG